MVDIDEWKRSKLWAKATLEAHKLVQRGEVVWVPGWFRRPLIVA